MLSRQQRPGGSDPHSHKGNLHHYRNKVDHRYNEGGHDLRPVHIIVTILILVAIIGFLVFMIVG